jgi:hypothetical protein
MYGQKIRSTTSLWGVIQLHCISVKPYYALTDLLITGATTQNMVTTDDASVKTK